VKKELSMLLPKQYSGVGRRGVGPVMSRRGVAAAEITEAQRNAAQGFINSWCHGLRDCDATVPAHQWDAYRQLAEECVHNRSVVYQYYREQGLPDNGHHLEAIDHDDWVARSCGGA
jgi:hypothetical protein